MFPLVGDTGALWNEAHEIPKEPGTPPGVPPASRTMSTPSPPVSSRQLSATSIFPWDTSITRAARARHGVNSKKNNFRSMKMFRCWKMRAQILSSTRSFWSLQVPQTDLQLHPKNPWHIFFFFFSIFNTAQKSTPNNTNAEVQLMSLLAQKDKMWHSKIRNPLSSFFAILVQNYQALALWVIH